MVKSLQESRLKGNTCTIPGLSVIFVHGSSVNLDTAYLNQGKRKDGLETFLYEGGGGGWGLKAIGRPLALNPPPFTHLPILTSRFRDARASRLNKGSEDRCRTRPHNMVILWFLVIDLV